jgi:hypothetical protein
MSPLADHQIFCIGYYRFLAVGVRNSRLSSLRAIGPMGRRDESLENNILIILFILSKIVFLLK